MLPAKLSLLLWVSWSVNLFNLFFSLLLQEATRWANQYLGVGGYSDHLITDLSHDLADGITLIRLAQALCE